MYICDICDISYSIWFVPSTLTKENNWQGYYGERYKYIVKVCCNIFSDPTNVNFDWIYT